MAIRTTTKVVTFNNPFSIGGFDEVLPAGSYSVETDEELLEGISFPAYRRVRTLMHLPVRTGRPGHTHTWMIDPSELDAAMKRDQIPAEMAVDLPDIPATTTGSTDLRRREEGDRQAIERGEDEGMAVHQG